MPYAATIRLVGSGAPSAGSNGLLDCQVAMARDAAFPDGLLLALVFDNGAQLARTRASASANSTDALSRGISLPAAVFFTRHPPMLITCSTILTMRQPPAHCSDS